MYFQILKTVINRRYKSNFVLFQKYISKCPYHMQILPPITASGMNPSQRNKKMKKSISTQSRCNSFRTPENRNLKKNYTTVFTEQSNVFHTCSLLQNMNLWHFFISCFKYCHSFWSVCSISQIKITTRSQ